ncbi:class I SAM-dependent methyltransferase [Catellatospora sp. NPDC049111]|uniref:class I SAM-dependent methyltransferase n=1 Tax=Catellatospora sp. NPDC049111 TaxID=3155271 RepID=UPI0034109F13
MADLWTAGVAYEVYMGRWSARIADAFVRLLAVPSGRSWLDVGCGTGALTAAVLARAEPSRVTGVDPAEGFLAHARTRVTDPRVTFYSGDARSLPVPDGSFDAVVSGLMLNFVPEPEQAVSECVRAAAPGGVVAAYVWDYAEGMALLRHFWDAATAGDPAAAPLDEGRRFPLCRPEPLSDLWTRAGLAAVTVRPVELVAVFTDFADLWTPFLGGQGPAPGHVATLSAADRDALRDRLHDALPVAADGSITLPARAWAVSGVRPS